MEKNIKQFASISLPMVQIVPCKGQIVVKNGTAVTFWGRLVGDDSGYIYTFNAFGESKERVLRLNLKEDSRVIITGFEKPYRNGNHYDISISVSGIDFCPSNNDGFRRKTVEALLAGGKLSLSEIADALSLSMKTVMKIRDEMQSQKQEPRKEPVHVQERPENQRIQQNQKQTVPQQEQQKDQKPSVPIVEENDEIDIDEFLRIYGT